jgi:predicted DsbA family dithiol-disulfide isomerase
MQIEVFADIWCPFAHVGLRAVAEHLRRVEREDVALIVRAWPLELVNGAPMDASKARHHADDLRAQVTPELFGGLDAEHFPTSMLEALALAQCAGRAGPEVGLRVSFALRDALFERGQDISDPEVLRTLAAEHHLGPVDDRDRAAVLEDWHDGQRRGVLGSPHFFCGEDSLFCPSLAISRTTEGQLVVEQDRAKLTAFLDRCCARS